jgi:hypothetical protein
MEKFESGLDGRLWESVTFATDELLEGKMGHRMIVVITDGVDEAGHDITFTRAMERVRQTATTVHVVNLSQYLDEQIRKQAYGIEGVIGIIKSPSFIGRRRELRQYRERLNEAPEKMIQAAEESGGKFFFANPDENLSLLPKQIWEQIEGQFMVAYEPERPDSGRSIKPVRPVSAFPTRGDIEVRSVPILFAPIVSPRSAPTGERLRRQ